MRDGNRDRQRQGGRGACRLREPETDKGERQEPGWFWGLLLAPALGVCREGQMVVGDEMSMGFVWAWEEWTLYYAASGLLWGMGRGRAGEKQQEARRGECTRIEFTRLVLRDGVRLTVHWRSLNTASVPPLMSPLSAARDPRVPLVGVGSLLQGSVLGLSRESLSTPPPPSVPMDPHGYPGLSSKYPQGAGLWLRGCWGS